MRTINSLCTMFIANLGTVQNFGIVRIITFNLTHKSKFLTEKAFYANHIVVSISAVHKEPKNQLGDLPQEMY